jgi:DNA-binding CsgD family transcriptional regulator
MQLESSAALTEHAVARLLADTAAHARGRRGPGEPSLFLMNHDLVVESAAGESILRLPWFEDELFVGRQLPDISEMPKHVRLRGVDHYRAALAGERGRFVFVSYGHAYSLDAVPVYREDESIIAALGIATPMRGVPGAASAYERAAERFEGSAARARRRAARYRHAGRHADEHLERERAARWLAAAERARGHAVRLWAGRAGPDVLSVTPREADVLGLASHGLTAAEIADALVVSAGTVRTHLENVYAKLGVSDKAAAVATALRHGLID